MSRPSARQKQILHQLANGNSITQIARHLKFSRRTVVRDLSSYRFTFAQRSNTAAVAHALRQGWIK